MTATTNEDIPLTEQTAGAPAGTGEIAPAGAAPEATSTAAAPTTAPTNTASADVKTADPISTSTTDPAPAPAAGTHDSVKTATTTAAPDTTTKGTATADNAAPPQYSGNGPASDDLSHDLNHWVDRFSHAANNSHAVTEVQGDQPWSSGFFDCCNPIETCLCGTFVPCMLFSRTHHRLHKDASLRDWSPVNGSCIFWYVTSHCFVGWIGTLLQRNELRERGKLQGDFATDCLKAFCCGCCDLIQQDKEAEALLARQPAVAAQPEKQSGMDYKPQ